MMDKELLEILACPECKAPVQLEQAPSPGAAGPASQASAERLVCSACGRRYPIRDGIPIMLVEEAEPPAPEWKPKAK